MTGDHNMPKRIWAWRADGKGLGRWHYQPPASGGAKGYVRGDIHAVVTSRLARAEAELETLRAALNRHQQDGGGDALETPAKVIPAAD